MAARLLSLFAVLAIVATVLGSDVTPVKRLNFVDRMRTRRLSWSDVLSPANKKFDKDGSNFDILTKLAIFADLATTITTTPRITVFAPNDAAFIRLAKSLTGCRCRTEKAAFDTLFGVVSKGIRVKGTLVKGKALVSAILLYHVSKFRIPSRFVLGHPSLISTLSKKYIISTGKGELVDLSPKTPNPLVIKADIKIRRGVIVHVIDYVLLPVPLTPAKTC